MSVNRFTDCPTAPVWRQITAMFYDGLLITAMLFIATAILLPFTQGEAIQSRAYPLYLVFLIFLFYSWFWHKAGQTLGMKAWKIRIITDDGYNPGWQTSFLRLVFAVISMLCLGLGYWWQWFRGYTWHDSVSQTRIIYVKS